jgi:superfamily II DNA or RNA helicase
MFLSNASLRGSTWQSFERSVARLLLYEGFEGIRLVGQTADHGADLLASKFGKRWLFQVKHWRQRVGLDVLDQVLAAAATYHAQVSVIVALTGFDKATKEHQRHLMATGMSVQLWDADDLVHRAGKIPAKPPARPTPRPYQEEVIRLIVNTFLEGFIRRGIVVMATGLGKTYVAAEALRRISSTVPIRSLVLAHTNELVYQLERSFWQFLSPKTVTLVWNGYERPDFKDLEKADFVFACVNTVAEHAKAGRELPTFDCLLVDECHHGASSMYGAVLDATHAGKPGGPFLLGLTATPWRGDERNLHEYFGETLSTVDMVTGLRNGYLANVDYRMYTDNIKWETLQSLRGRRFSPRRINRTLFITEWDDAVVLELQAAWRELPNPRAIVFCGTIDHAITMRDRINALRFCNTAAVYSQTSWGQSLLGYERNRILCDFQDGRINVVCTVDLFNEGIDVPDVNIIVFQRVTHSRRIFVQQLGRGLRIAEGKDKVIVLDFVSDIRRFAAGLDLKDSLSGADSMPGRTVRVNLQHKVTFRRVGGEDPQTETFLRQWLDDITEIADATEDASVLKFPPPLPGGRK